MYINTSLLLLSKKELATVLDSLNKLADLEQRISTLEANNQYESLISKEKGNKANKNRGGNRGVGNALDFKKRRTKTEVGRTQLVYGIKEPSRRQGDLLKLNHFVYIS